MTFHFYKTASFIYLQKELTLAKLKSHVHTELRRLPSTAVEYPIPPERKEIKLVNGVDLKLVSL